jgi:hypothetical protein
VDAGVLIIRAQVQVLEHLAARHPGLLPGPRVEALRQILVQNYHWDCAGRLRWRDDEAGAGHAPLSCLYENHASGHPQRITR